MADITTKYKSKWTGAEIDDGIEKARNAVPLDGGKAMTGALRIENDWPAVLLRNASIERESCIELEGGGGLNIINRNGSDSSKYLIVTIGKDNSHIRDLINISVNNDAGSAYYRVLHTGNKPSGSYTGNGDAAERVIDTGGIGNYLMLSNSVTTSMVGPDGALSFNASTGTITTHGPSEARFLVGVLTMRSAHADLNYLSYGYYYQVL